MKNFYQIKKRLKVTYGRFPLTVIFCTALMLFVIIMNHSGLFIKESKNFALAIYLVSNVGLSFCIDLCRQIYKKRIVIINGIIWHLLIIANAFYANKVFWELTPRGAFDVLSVIMLCMAFPFILPFVGQNDDMRMWHFIRRFIRNTLYCGIIVWVLSSCLLGLFHLTGVLFHININMYHDLLAVILCWVFPVLVLSRTKPLKRIETAEIKGKSSINVFRFFVWLLIILLVIRVIYMLQIAISWELPKGGVAVPISFMMFLLIMGFCMGYGITKDAKNKEAKFLKIMPILALLPLLLMSVGIGRRLMDYGMTAPRFYLVLLNLWFYSMCVYMMVKQRIMPIVVSFVVIAFMSSFGPTSAWRLFDVNEIAEATKNQEIVEKPKYKHIEYAGYDYMYDGFEIKLPEPAKNLTFFEIYDGFELLPTENGNEYLIESIEGFPFIISRNKLINKEQVPLILKCTNGKYIVLTKWKCRYNDDETSKEVEINEMLGFMVE